MAILKEHPLDPPEYHERPEREYNADTTDRFEGKGGGMMDTYDKVAEQVLKSMKLITGRTAEEDIAAIIRTAFSFEASGEAPQLCARFHRCEDREPLALRPDPIDESGKE